MVLEHVALAKEGGREALEAEKRGIVLDVGTYQSVVDLSAPQKTFLSPHFVSLGMIQHDAAGILPF